MSPAHSHHKYWYAILALLVLPISGISIDIYIPSLPAVSRYFQVDKSLIQLTITTYMIGLGFMQIIAGSISDSYGRKKPFIIASIIYIIATTLIPSVQNVTQLLVLRFIQGSAVALNVVPMRSVLIDLFEGRELKKIMNYMTMVWSIGPIIAPAIGGYLQHYFNWQANFYFLTVYSVTTTVLVIFFLPETSQHFHAFHLKSMIKRYVGIISNRTYFLGLMTNGLLYSFIILFSVTAPFLIQNVLHYSAIEFGNISLMMGAAWFLGTMTNRLLIDMDLQLKVKTCLSVMLVIIIIMLSSAIYFPLNIYSIVIPIASLLWVGGIIFPNYFARSLALFPHASGSANALFGASVFLIAGISSGIGSLLKSNSELPLIGGYLIIIALCFALYFLDFKIKRANASE